MSQTVSIDPVTRIEGHGKVFLDLGPGGAIESAGLIVNELRGFERILVGIEADRMPLITARICGVCPSAHHLAASKALDAAAGVQPPPAAVLLRELLYMGHFIHSHTLSLFILQGPDLVLGLDADPAIRNVVGVVNAVPEVAKKALRCRTLGQKVNELVGGRGVHPVTSVPGGITFRLDPDKCRLLESWFEEAVGLAAELVPIARDLVMKQVTAHPALIDQWVLPTWSLGTTQAGRLSLYDGTLRAVDETGTVRAEFPSSGYADHVRESSLPWSYMKPVRFACDGSEHRYRVGPLARLNVADATGTPLADAELDRMRRSFGRPAHATVLQSYARAIELLHAAERGVQILRDRRIAGETRSAARFRGSRGIGHVEAPRGSLFHDYEIDDQGIVRAANLVVATQQNYDAINESIAQAARSHVAGRGDRALLNAVEFAIRCYDPCLSCATHAVGRMPLEVTVRQGGRIVRRLGRDVNGQHFDR